MEELSQGKRIENLKSLVRKDGRSYSIRTHRDRFFYPDEWGKFFDKLNKRQKFTFKFLINTGARINEARNVRVEDIDLERKRMILRITKVKAKKGEKHPRPRTIPISTQFAKYLKAYIKIKGLANPDYLNILSTPASNIGMKLALQRAGIKDWYMFSVHNVRKTLETWLMSLNIDGLKITAHIGHSMAVASKNYVSADVFSWDEKKQIRMIIGDLYER
jgi:integrase